MVAARITPAARRLNVPANIVSIFANRAPEMLTGEYHSIPMPVAREVARLNGVSVSEVQRVLCDHNWSTQNGVMFPADTNGKAVFVKDVRKSWGLIS